MATATAAAATAAAAAKRLSQDEDVISHYSAISGETYASRRSRRACSSVRMTSTDLLAKNLREYHAKQENGGLTDASKPVAANAPDPHGLHADRWNKSFHHFRILVVMMGGISVGLMMLMRYSISISILRMVNQTHLYLEEHPNSTVDDFLAEGYSLGGEFLWNNEIVQIILSWYMLSYTLPQMPASRLAVKIGCRLAVALSLALCAVSLLLTPWIAYFGWKYVVLLRLVNGLGASAIMPMMLHLVESWMRYDDISFGLSIAQTLNASMVTLTPLIAGYLTEIHWKHAFYVPGAFALAFCLLWFFLISDTPELSKFISTKELLYIRECTPPAIAAESAKGAKPGKENGGGGGGGGGGEEEDDETADYKPDSWLQILRVPSFYAFLLMWCFYCSAYSGFCFILPTYMRQFLKIPVSQNGIYCFIIQMGGIVSVLWPHPILRMLQNAGLSITKSRIIAHFICCSMVAATWILVGAFHETQLFLLFLNRCFHNGNDIIVTGTLMSNYAKAGLSSLAFSLVNTIGNLSIVASSTFIGWTLDYTGQSREGWTWIYGALGVSQLLMFTIFALFVDSNPIKFKNKRHATGRAMAPTCDLEASQGATANGALEKKGAKPGNNYDKLKEAAGNGAGVKGPANKKD